MDQRIGDQLADGDGGIERAFLAEGRSDMLVPRQQPVDVIDQPLKPCGIAALPILTMGHGVGAARPAKLVLPGSDEAPEPGMIRFSPADGRFYGYDGSAWRRLDNDN